jgi:hypothetical protein
MPEALLGKIAKGQLRELAARIADAAVLTSQPE